MANINITMCQRDQDAICDACPLPDCVGRDCHDCPIQVEQRRRWRADYYQRVGSRPRRKYTRKAEQAGRETINA